MPASPGPKALAKWLAGSVRKDPAEVIGAASGEAGACDPGHRRTWVVLAGGAGHQLDLIRAGAARRTVEIRIVTGLIHVLEYIWKAAWRLRLTISAACCAQPPRPTGRWRHRRAG